MEYSKKRRPERQEYRQDRSQNRRHAGDDDGQRERILTKVTCDSCGKPCTVPFRPTAGKPVYCNDCFRKEDSGSRGERSSAENNYRGGETRSRHSSPADTSSSINRDLSQINRKLDRILALLEDDLDEE